LSHPRSEALVPLSLALKQKAALLDFLDISHWKNPVAITLTMKQGRFIGRTFVKLTPELSSQNLRHFRNVMNRKAFKNASHKLKMKSVAIQSFRIAIAGPFRFRTRWREK
jgi:hypothetical protein